MEIYVLLGAIVPATYPVAVVALLKELGATKRLSTLIEAESLLNDGTAQIAFVIMREYAAFAANTTFSTQITKLLQLVLAFGGVAYCIAFGIATYWLLSEVFSYHEVEITLTSSLAYLAFYSGDIGNHFAPVVWLFGWKCLIFQTTNVGN